MARILLIDDDDAVRGMLRLALTHFGHRVVEARNGKEGLQLFDEEQFDLIITDIVMPETEGVEVLLKIRRKDPSRKVIAISGGGRIRGAEDYLHTARLLGAPKVLAKPFSIESLMDAVNELLAQP